MSWVQTEQVVHVAVLILRVIDILAPLHDLAVASYLIWREFGENLFPLLAQLAVNAKNLTCRNGVEQYLAYYSVYECRSLVNRAVLG